MDDYNLDPGEFVIMQESSVRLDDDTTLDELVLTDKNLILVATTSKGLFSRAKYVKRCPLAKLRRVQDSPQAMVSKYRDDYRLQVLFQDETIFLTFSSGSKRSAERWGDAIRRAAEGDLSGIQTEDALPAEIADLVDGAKGVFGALFSGGDKSSGGSSSSAPSTVNTKCVGCHAPLSGRKGSTVTCPYCDTRQAL